MAILGLVLGLVAAGSSGAVNLPKEGSYEVVSCWTGTANDIVVAKGYSAHSYLRRAGLNGLRVGRRAQQHPARTSTSTEAYDNPSG